MMPLKSDHFGIEIKVVLYALEHKNALKSDHFGIEIKDHKVIEWQTIRVKIRPFWD